MGRGDKKTRKGKIWRGSYGKSRPKRNNQTVNQKKAEKKNG